MGVFKPCWSLINFEATENPPWRLRLDQDTSNCKSVGHMIREIAEFQSQWQELQNNSKNGETDNTINSAIESMVERFVFHVCKEEEVGLQDTEFIRKIRKCPKFVPRDNMEKETQNIFRAYNCINDLSRESKENPEFHGLIDIEACIKETHRILMDGVLDHEHQTPAGRFSTQTRVAHYGGKFHQYPKFESEEHAENAVYNIIDRYNILVSAIKHLENAEEQIYKFFKCAAWLLFNLVSLHPFSDGNGRLCRLLCSYCLSVLAPFPTPIYNIFSSTVKKDFVDALIKARESSDGHPCDLTTLIIESSWYAWKEFLGEIKTSAKNHLSLFTQIGTNKTCLLVEARVFRLEQYLHSAGRV